MPRRCCICCVLGTLLLFLLLDGCSMSCQELLQRSWQPAVLELQQLQCCCLNS
jgi:hypothetical protein